MLHNNGKTGWKTKADTSLQYLVRAIVLGAIAYVCTLVTKTASNVIEIRTKIPHIEQDIQKIQEELKPDQPQPETKPKPKPKE